MIDERDLEIRLGSLMCGLNPDNQGIINLLSILPIGVSITTDVSCHEIWHNPAAAQFLRIPESHALPHLADNLPLVRVFRKGQERFSDEMPLQRAAWFGESIRGDELEFVWEDGTRKTSRWNANPIYGDTGIITGAIAVCEDITTRKRAYNKLRAHQKNLRKMVKERTNQLGKAKQTIQEEIARHSQTERVLSLAKVAVSKVFQYSPDSISISTLKEGRYIQINDAFTSLTGYKDYEVIGCTVKELGIWVFPEERAVMLRQIQMHGIITNFEMQLRIKSGRVLICLVSGGTIDIEGETHIICVIKDITERKYMEEKLRFSEERFTKYFNSSPYPMCISTLYEGRFIEVNESFCIASGYSPDELIGRSVIEDGLWLNPEERRLVEAKITSKGSVRDLEISFRTRSGEHRVALFNAESIDVQGTPCLLSVVMDITEKKQIEVEMLRLDRLNLVGEMAASIGHEIRNPMTTVRGYLQLLKENEKYIPEVESFDLMIEELDRANLIITEFLSLAKNKLVELKPGNINSIINKLLPLLQASALLRDHRIKTELGDLPDLLLDKKEIRQLILNLVQNGLESMSWSGSVIIGTCIEKGKIVLTVNDQGHGIERQDLDKLGTPFFTTKENGTGLGLAVCYRIAAHHNAKIEIETGSTGTTFYIIFPLKPSCSATKMSEKEVSL